MVEAGAELADDAVRLELRVERPRASEEQLDAVAFHERRHGVHPLALQLQAFPARNEHHRPGRVGQPGELARSVAEQVLGVVEQEQRPLSRQRVRERVGEIPAASSLISSACATAVRRSDGSRGGASGTHVTPSGKASAASAAA
jgi:hypothetical protein